MSLNIVDLVKDQISDQLLGQLGNVLGTDGTQTSSAVGSAVPGLLAGLVKSSSTPSGADSLFNAVKSQDPGLLGNMGNLLGGGQSSQVVNQGTSLLGNLLGNGAVGKLAGVLAGFTGLSRGNSSSLMGLVAPLIIGVIKNKLFDSNTNASGLAGLLGGQQANINAAMPQGLSDQLQTSGFLDSINTASDTAAPAAAATATTAQATSTASTHTSTPEKSGGIMRWLIPVIGLGLLGWLGMKFLGNNDVSVDVPDATAVTDAASNVAGNATDAAGNAVDSATDAVGNAVDSATDAAGNAADNLNNMELPEGVTLPEGVDLDTLSGGLGDVFQSTSESLTSITDVDSATAAVPGLQDAAAKLGGVNDVIGRIPEAARGPLQKVAQGGVDTLQPLLDKVLAIPGVGSVLEPVVNPMVEMLKGLAG